ncbi:uncharacterized protein LY89DRAFT_765910 [Mollisia scopiformis]|uniref:Uncharacterized protein n=1 Tax=Mollisia scopiformis TaxID=149040 RepID=A0A132B6G0_MOLSC|nr:uncharacterized protein LY89DRAFT_765910 [Mollisia scopiformis]KUJ07843.1 hypothetical protein LY89DRAFT_765910 [Mollisia scopiformis]
MSLSTHRIRRSEQRGREKARLEPIGEALNKSQWTVGDYDTSPALSEDEVGDLELQTRINSSRVPARESRLAIMSPIVIASFTKELLEHPQVIEWANEAATNTPADVLKAQLSNLLEDYYRKLVPFAAEFLGDGTPDLDPGDIIRRGRLTIVRYFREGAKESGTVVDHGFLDDARTSTRHDLSWKSLSNWGFPAHSIDSTCDEVPSHGNSSNIEILIYYSEVRTHLIESQPFEHLVAQFRNWYLTQIDQHPMPLVISSEGIPTDKPDSPKSLVSLKMHWDLRSFLETQYGPNSHVKLESVITISGSAICCQALTVADYLKQKWPGYGVTVLEALQSALDSPESRAEVSDGSPKPANKSGDNRIPTDMKVVEVKVQGSSDDIVLMKQIFSWVGAAIRTSKSSQAEYSECVSSPDGEDQFFMDFVQTPTPEAETTCWLPLFKNAVIATGFPTAARTNHEIGVEIPLEMMAVLIGAERAVEHDGGILIKGFSSVLVPVARKNDSVQWHLLENSDGTRLKYSDIRERCQDRLSIDELSQESLREMRVFLGWLRHAKSFFGTPEVAYKNITASKADKASKTLSLTDITVGFSKLGSASTKFALGAREVRYISRANRLERLLDAAEEMDICLYDFDFQRSWMASGTEVLLHLIHTKHTVKPFCIAGQEITLEFASPAENGPDACRAAIMSMASLSLYSSTSVSVTSYCVQDLVNDLWLRLEKLEEPGDQPGIPISMKFSTKLAGYEIMDIVLDKGVLRQKEVSLKNTSGKWLDIIKACDGVVLFGSHFGHLIRPALSNKGLCPDWTNLPDGKDYMATTVQKLLRFFGNANEVGHLTSAGLTLHKVSVLFESCRNQSSSCCCQRVLQVIPKSRISFKSATPPGSLGSTGCVIIGRAARVLRSRKLTSRNTASRSFGAVDYSCEDMVSSREESPENWTSDTLEDTTITVKRFYQTQTEDECHTYSGQEVAFPHPQLQQEELDESYEENLGACLEGATAQLSIMNSGLPASQSLPTNEDREISSTYGYNCASTNDRSAAIDNMHIDSIEEDDNLEKDQLYRRRVTINTFGKVTRAQSQDSPRKLRHVQKKSHLRARENRQVSAIDWEEDNMDTSCISN